jgi:hypothetical protein
MKKEVNLDNAEKLYEEIDCSNMNNWLALLNCITNPDMTAQDSLHLMGLVHIHKKEGLIEKEELIELLEKNQYNKTKVAERLDVNSVTVLKLMRKYGIEGRITKNKKVMQYDLEGNYLRTFKSFKAAADFLGVSPCGISQVNRGTRKQSNGYIWKFE